MNKVLKILVAILGGVNVAFSVFIPITIALVIINTVRFDHSLSTFIVLLAGILSSLYRGIDVALLRN